MTKDIAGKNFILVSPRYFNYEVEVKEELERRGASVYFIDDRIENSTINKALFRLNLWGKRGKKRILEYFDQHLKAATNKKKIDFLIAIIPEGFSKEIIERYRTELKGTIFILYMWDSIENRPYIIDTLYLYNYTYTFDKNNSKEYGLTFRPLFYTREYAALSKTSNNFEYDLSFIGTAHSDRYNVINRLVKSANVKLNSFFFFYLQHPIVMFYYKLTDSKFKNVKMKDISFRGLNKQEVLSVIKKSRCIVDINHPKQTGLTIRTLEVLGAHRKLITTNADVINYDFYHPDNILVIERQDPKLAPDFLSLPYVLINSNIYEKYSITSWIDDILPI